MSFLLRIGQHRREVSRAASLLGRGPADGNAQARESGAAGRGRSGRLWMRRRGGPARIAKPSRDFVIWRSARPTGEMMALGLILLAAAMMVSGAAAVMFGSEIIMVERGWAMVIAGATSFSAGAVLLGIAAVLRALERLHHGIAGGRDLALPREPEARPQTVAPAKPAPIVLPAPAVAAPEPRPAPTATPPEPVRAEPSQPSIEVAPAAAESEEEWAPEMPELRAERAYERQAYNALPNGSHPHGESDILVAPDPPRLRIVETRPAPPPAFPEPMRAPEPPRQPEPEPVSVVGKYSSGGNSYVMFSDGSIH